MISKKHKKVCRTRNYIEHFLILASTIMRKKDDKIVLLAKSKLNSIEVLISKALINSAISHDDFVLIDNVLKEYNDMKEEIKN